MGKLTIIAGDPDLGKSFVTLDIAARVSSGRGWPDAVNGPIPPGDVVLLSAEDGLADTIRPRLDTAQANVNRIVALQGIRLAGEKGEDHFSLRHDLPALEQVITRKADTRLVIIDPITAYLGGTDSYKNADVRSLLSPLCQLAARHGVAVLAVTHLNKGMGGKALHRAIGSVGFIATARAAWLFIADKDSPDRRLMLPSKMNLAAGSTGLAYTLLDGKVAWEREPVQMTANEALASELSDASDPGERDEACEWLQEVLAGGPVPAACIWEQARENRVAERTLKRAKKEIGVRTYREGYGPGGKWLWALAEHRGPDQTIGGQAK